MTCTSTAANLKASKTLKLNLANILTLFRIAAIPVVVICFYSPIPNARPIAAIIFGIAAITDMIDGWVARKYGQTSRFGEFLDPVADKLMVSIVLVMLVQAQAGWFEDIIAMIIIGREITISALREWMATIGERTNVKVDVTGKIKTTLQMFGIAFMVYNNPFFGIDVYAVGFVLLVAAAIMTVWSMFIYLRAAWPFIMMDDDESKDVQ
jgi:CDP-diacylglycerol--glycerol-3-phosphate 3-phosphatidyltransferase/cardiolipin synthase